MLHPWPKGKSPNPGGRSKELVAALGKARKLVPDVIDRVYAIACNARSTADRLRACELLLDRALGKPKQQVALDGQMVQHSFVIAVPADNLNAADWEARYGPRLIEHEPIQDAPSEPWEAPELPAVHGGGTVHAEPVDTGYTYTGSRPAGHTLEPSNWPQTTMPIPGDYVRPDGEALPPGGPRVKARG